MMRNNLTRLGCVLQLKCNIMSGWLALHLLLVMKSLSFCINSPQFVRTKADKNAAAR